ncbi:MAG TPA: AraC family transcriptional regulator [Chitinophaga sp.]|nr:AraC family transcriptional regulator [Chitinophaga sp.]
MEILITPGQQSDPGKLTPIPSQLRKHVASWAHTECRKYDFGYILTQHFKHRHYRIYIYCFIVEKVTAAYAYWEKPVVALQATLQGEIKGKLKGEVNVLLPTDTLGLFYLPPGIHEIYLEKGFMESIHIELEPDHVEELTEDWNGQQELMNRVNAASEKGLPFQRADMNYMIKAVIERMRNMHKTGSLLKLEFRSCIAELLKLYLHEMEENTHTAELMSVEHKDKDKLLSIWRSIKTNPNIHLHHLSELARQHYLHPKTLSRNFGKLFGSTLRDFVLEQCMRKGHFLITTTGRKIDEIAEELGYQETKSFNRAFQKQFKITPQSLRYNQR